jgi:hypothetical protein
VCSCRYAKPILLHRRIRIEHSPTSWPTQ